IHSARLVLFRIAFWREAIIRLEVPPSVFIFSLCRDEIELETRFAAVEHNALQLAMLVHRSANPLLVRRNEEMVPIAKRLIQRHPLAGVCGESDPSRCRPLSFARI